MVQAHLFQRYSSPENTVTNNTLLLLSRMHAHSTARFTSFLREVLDDQDLDLGLTLVQQKKPRGSRSIPDGRLRQRSFELVIETKVTAGVQEDQLVRHAEGMHVEGRADQSRDDQILLLLSKEPISEEITQRVQKAIAQVAENVRFAAVTFQTLCTILDGFYKEFEPEMVALAEDFIRYCGEEHLTDDSARRMRVVPCGDTLDINLRHGIYYMPASRGYRPHRFIGLYRNKAIRGVIDVESVFEVTSNDAGLDKQVISGEATDAYDSRIEKMISDARAECGHGIAQGHLFFCGTVAHVQYEKISKHGIQGARYFAVPADITRDSPLDDFVEKIDGASWE